MSKKSQFIIFLGILVGAFIGTLLVAGVGTLVGIVVGLLVGWRFTRGGKKSPEEISGRVENK